MSAPQPRLEYEFRLAPEYRRCCWYVVFGMLLILCVAAGLRHWGLVPANQTWTSFAVGSLVLITAACAMLFAVCRWKLRVDEIGLSRRRLFRWDVWTWDEFGSGEIQRCGDGFISTKRPCWRSQLTFCFLSEKDQNFVRSACKFFFRPVENDAADLPDREIMARYQFFYAVSFREDGVAGHTRRGDFNLLWSEVNEVRLIFYDHWSSEVCRIELEIPGRTVRIEGLNKVTAPNLRTYRIANPRVFPNVIPGFLRRHVPGDKLTRHALHGPPATHSECQHRRLDLQHRIRKVTWFYRTVPAGALILTSLCFAPKLIALWRGPAVFPNLAWPVLTTVLTVATMLAQPLTIWAFLRDIRKRHGKAIRELDVWEHEQRQPKASKVVLQTSKTD